MNRQIAPRSQRLAEAAARVAGRILQRKCACGNHTVAGGACAACSKKSSLQRQIDTDRDATMGFSHSQISPIRRKLTIGATNDPLEDEADRIADQVLAASAQPASGGTAARIQRFAGPAAGQVDAVPASVDSVLAGSGSPLEPALRGDMEQRFGHDFSRVRVHSGAASEQSAGEVDANGMKLGTLHRKARGQNDVAEVPPIVHDVLRSPGQPLDAEMRAFMEPRFGHDFSQVRVHADAQAAESARAVSALAYTVGRDVVLGAGKYAPRTNVGLRLMAHELAHVVQQGEGKEVKRLSRFSDTDHNIIEEVALTLAKLSPEEIKQIHAGNTKRDYSQSPAQLNLVLLCDASNYGGYKPVEHFDNFRWDEELQKWQSREDPTAFGKKSPINHIDEELVKFVDSLPDKTAFQHVGSAFHAIEDFFAHSNFVELTHGDFTHGRELITGSVGKSDDVSLLKILESISSQETAPYYGERADKEIAEAPAKSHARMAKDYKANPYHLEAVVLAGLVVKEIGTDILAIKALTANEQRIKYVRDVIMTKVKRYLRPPDGNDKWWETLRASGGKEMETAIRETAAKTPVTKNQCILSPLRSIEASRDSNMKLIGAAFPVETKHGHAWVQLGTGFSTTPAFAGPTGTVEPRRMEFLPVGVQITGRF